MQAGLACQHAAQGLPASAECGHLRQLGSLQLLAACPGAPDAQSSSDPAPLLQAPDLAQDARPAYDGAPRREGPARCDDVQVLPGARQLACLTCTRVQVPVRQWSCWRCRVWLTLSVLVL